MRFFVAGTYALVPTARADVGVPVRDGAAAPRHEASSITTANAKYFFTVGNEHPTLEDPTVIGTPTPGSGLAQAHVHGLAELEERVGLS